MNISEVQTAVCQEYGISLEALKARSNRPSIVRPRQVAMYLAHAYTLCSLPRIGREFAGKHHTTVLYAIEHVKTLRASDLELNLLIRRIEEKLEILEAAA